MKKLQLSLFFIFCSLMIFSCSKTEIVPKTNTDLLSANTWKVSKVVQNQNGKSIVYFEKGVTPASARDDFNKVRATFMKNGSVTLIDGDNKSSNGTWTFVNSESQIEIKESTSGKKNTLFVKRLEAGYFNFTEKDGSDSSTYELIPE